jgi:hypothetical protein
MPVRDYGKAQACPALLGSEKGPENLSQAFPYAAARVTDSDFDLTSFSGTRRLASGFSSRISRLDAVDGEVDEALLDLILVDVHQGWLERTASSGRP